MTDRLMLRYDAKQKIAAATPSPQLITLVFLVITIVVGYVINRLSAPMNDWYYYYYYNYLTGVYAKISALNSEAVDFMVDYLGLTGIRPVYERTIWISASFIIVLRLMVNIISVGYRACCLRVSRGWDAKPVMLGDAFGSWGKIICILILKFIFIFLWSCLFVFPGIAAAYRYRMAWYAMLDHPEYGALECLRESKRLMRGHKAELFMLDFSFLGWWILCQLTMDILSIWKKPYFYVCYALFYQNVCGAGTPGPEAPDISGTNGEHR